MKKLNVRNMLVRFGALLVFSFFLLSPVLHAQTGNPSQAGTSTAQSSSSNLQALQAKLDQAPLADLKAKFSQLDALLKNQFADDFSATSVDDLKKLQAENLFDVWKNDLRSSNLAELNDFKGKGNLRNEYMAAVDNLKNEKTALLAQNKSLMEVAKTLHQRRRDTGEKFKNATPDDLREWIYKFNNKRYGDKLGPKFESLLSKAKASGMSDEQAYNKIIDSSSTPLGDKMALGAAMRKAFDNTPELPQLVKILEKYRM